jgi:predicted  nucleic acid-binding Zn-ribbon protein
LYRLSVSPQPVDSAQEFSGLEEMELKERIKMLKDQEKALRDERHFLESKLRNMILARYAELMKKYGARDDI